MEKTKSLPYKIRISLLLLSGLLAFCWIYFVFFNFSLLGIETTNQLKKEIQQLSQEKQYNEIVKKSFHILNLDSTQQNANFWNLASAYYLLNQKQIAYQFYDTLRQIAPLTYQARALHQLGNILYLQSPDSLEAALEAYKNALYLQDNKQLRYNYELLKKIQEKNTPMFQKKQQNKSSQTQTPKNEKKQETSPDEEDKPNDFLEAISNQEQEQIRKYQLRKVKHKNSSLPDW